MLGVRVPIALHRLLEAMAAEERIGMGTFTRNLLQEIVGAIQRQKARSHR